jgi:hypothetical protein
MSAPDGVESFDFRYPLGAVGFSSGWRRAAGFSLNRQPQLSARLQTKLVPCGRSMFLPFENGGLRSNGSNAATRSLRFMVKAPPDGDGITAITSGGGSAIFDWNGWALKLKRCGFAEDGFADEPFYSPSLVVKADDTLEYCSKNYGGLMPLESAIAELLWADRARNFGLAEAYRPAGLIVLTEPPDLPFRARPFGAAVFDLDSDLRVDELVMMALSPILTELFREKLLRLHPANEFHGANGFPLGASLARWTEVSRRLDGIGRASGGLYRKTHDIGLLRGRGSCWFGNEVVGRDGRLSLVDFDGGMEWAATFDTTLAERLRALEVEAYCAETFWFLTDMKPILFGVLATAYVAAFRDGYTKRADFWVDPVVVQDVIADHLPHLGEFMAIYGLDARDPERHVAGR